MNGVMILEIVHLISIGILFLMLIYAILQKPSEMQKHIVVLTVVTIPYLFGHVVRLNASTLEEALLGVSISYSGEPFVLLGTLILFCTFFGFKFPKKLIAVLSIIAAIVPVAVYTNSSHYLYYATVAFDRSKPFSPLVKTNGPLYYMNMVVSACYLIAMTIIVIRGFSKAASPIKKRLSWYCLLMVIVVCCGYLAYMLDLTNGYDATMLGTSIGVGLMAVLFFRCRIFDVVDQAKEYALEVSLEGLLVVDDANKVVYQNPSAKRMIQEGITLPTVLEAKEGKNLHFSNEQVFSISVNPISYGSTPLGKSIEIHDVTEIQNHQQKLEKAVHDTTERLEYVQRTILGSLASVVEARSLETGDHIKRVTRYTEMVAKELQKTEKYQDIITDEYLNNLLLTAPLHDIGKIAIPDPILLKPARLSSGEYEEMKLHAEKGAEILHNTLDGLEEKTYVDMATDIAMFHHERWDGNGYPNKLKGEEIPLSARIVALADCYDALTSKRCYKDAFPCDVAIAIIKEESGTHFDPDVVAAFLSNA